jgi:tRNA pseudouridine13 synthase
VTIRFPPSAEPPLERAILRACPEDFQVDEQCPVDPEPAGEHLWVRVRKRGWNTADVARVLARASGLRVRDVGYAGLKDRNALTTQWFSLWLRHRPEPRLDRLPEGIEVLERLRCARKLRRGMHTGNRFVIRLREVAPAAAGVNDRLGRIVERGFPNYFGPQRFGRNFRNVSQAAAMFRGEERADNRHLRGLRISAARAWIFNHVLARRVEEGTWNRLVEGDVADRDGRPTGPMWGEGAGLAHGAAAALEAEVAARFAELRDGLERSRMPPQRRPLVGRARDLNWRADTGGSTLFLEFVLDPGVYATALLAELVQEISGPARDDRAGPAAQRLRRSST